MKIQTWARMSLGFALVGLILPACQRSGAYKRDQNFPPADAPSYYSKGADKTPGQRIEQLGQPKKRVVVLDFWNDTPVKMPLLGRFAADELRRGLFITQRVIISPELKSEFTTEDMVQGDKVKVAQLIREGRRLGVAVLVIGRIVKVTFRQRGDEVGLIRQKQSLAAIDVELKMFDVGGGREILASGRSGESSSSNLVTIEPNSEDALKFRNDMTQMALRNAVGALVPDVLKGIEKMMWEGRIAKLAGNKAYINAGRASGLVVGDILKVLTPGDDIYDPATGAYLGRAQGQLKGTLEVVDFMSADGAVANLHTGAGFHEGDLVQLY